MSGGREGGAEEEKGSEKGGKEKEPPLWHRRFRGLLHGSRTGNGHGGVNELSLELQW